MKRILILLFGASFLLTPAVQAKSKHHHHHYDHDRYETTRYYSVPPTYVRRHWHRGNVYTWHDHRYHWHDGEWVIYSPIGRVVLYR